MILWLSGNTGAGKTTLADRLQDMGHAVTILDGDTLRGVWTDLGLSEAARREHNLRTARLAVMLEDQGHTVVVATICPYKNLREEIRRMTGCFFIYLDGGHPADELHPYEHETN